MTVYEAQDKAGGVLTYGIIPTRLPQEVVDFDIQTIEKLGVEFKFNEPIDASKLEELKNDYDAVFVGAGLWKSKMVDIPGKDLEGVVTAIDFLREAKTNTDQLVLGENVIVIGGGDVAMDCVTNMQNNWERKQPSFTAEPLKKLRQIWMKSASYRVWVFRSYRNLHRQKSLEKTDMLPQ